MRKPSLTLLVAITSLCTVRALPVPASAPAELNLKYEEPKYLTGAIYNPSQERKEPLFKLKRVATRSGPTLDVRREYNSADGKPAAREHVVYEGDTLVLYEVEELQTGASGSARIRHAPNDSAKAGIEFQYRKQGMAKPKENSETLAPDTLVNDMVGPFLLDHWDILMRGQKVRCRYIVVSRLETVGFTFSKASESKWQGHDVVIVRMEGTSAFVRALVDPLFFTIEKAPPHHVFEYSGRTTPKLNAGGKWKDLDAVTVFDWGTVH